MAFEGHPGLEEAVAARLDEAIVRVTRISGGDIAVAFRVDTASGRRCFVKTQVDGGPVYAAEARGLAWLGESATLRVPLVLGYGEDPPCLLLEYLEPAPRSAGFDEALGRGLAALHQSGANGFGLDHDNFIGSLRQVNAPSPDWPTFYYERRLLPRVRDAVDRGHLTPAIRGQFETLGSRLENRVGPPEPPARLHGDLWAGNCLCAGDGAPVLIDPAVYGGHREIDLAMMRLFGGFSARTLAAYEEVHPLAPGANERVALYQLYPLLVHVCLFGSSYVDPTVRALRSVL